MKFLAALAASCVVGAAGARPAIMKETGQIVYPANGYSFFGPAAVDGDDAIILGYRDVIDEFGDNSTYNGAFLFHRSGTAWSYVRMLAQGFDSGADDTQGHVAIAMKDGVAALSILPFFVFERQPNGDWVQAQTSFSTSGGAPPNDVEIDGGRIFLGDASWGGTVIEKNASGVWRSTQTLYGDYSGDGDNSSGGSVDLSGPWAAVADPYNTDDLPAPAITTFLNSGGSSGWQQTQRLLPLEGHAFGAFAVRGQDMFIDDTPYGLTNYTLDSNQQWSRHVQLRTPGDFMSGASQFSDGDVDTVKKSDDFIFQRVWDFDRNATVVRLFGGDKQHGYNHIATLIDSRGGNLGKVQISGRRVVAPASGRTLVFDLPASFGSSKSLFDETFDPGSTGTTNWRPFGSSQWSIVQAGNAYVYHQANTTGDAGAFYNTSKWASEAIQADITPTAFNGADRWVGLATRRSDQANYYYVTLRSSGTIALKRMKSGVFTTIASAPFPVALNETYRVRLESFGTTHRVYIDGALMLDAKDATLIAGFPALLTSRAAADFDNVIVSPSWTTTLYAANSGINYDPPKTQPEPWTYSGTGEWYWIADGSNLLFRQNSNSGDARAAIDPSMTMAPDQTVETRVRIRSFGTGTNDKWVGLMAKYADPGNFTYMSLRSSNQVTLRRVEGGRILELATVAMPVAQNTWYQLRLETINNYVRAYVNGNLVIEHLDRQHPGAGNGGLVTYKAAADFDDFRVVEP